MIKILIVDDEDDVLYSLKKGLEEISEDYRVQTATDGNKCLDVLTHETPDLILLDLMMPNMNGWQVLDVIQGNIRWREIPIFIITAVEDPEFKQTARDLGIPYIEKPFTIHTVKEKIDWFYQKNN